VVGSIVGDEVGSARLQDLTPETDTGDGMAFGGEPTDDDLVRCYHRCDLFVLPNRQIGRDTDGLACAVEVQASDKRVVTSASEGIAETTEVRTTGRLADF
jgi:phosphatidyl-myo-inositol dimannoside synthase